MLFELSAQNTQSVDSIKVVRDYNGYATYVNFIPSKGNPQLLTGAELSSLLSNSDSFFKKYFKLSENDEFRLIKKQARENGFSFERFQQYYKNIKVDNGYYTLQYFNGMIYLAHGDFIKIDQLNVIPDISPEESMRAFANYLKIPSEEIKDYKSELIINEFFNEDSIKRPLLVYFIVIDSNHPNNKSNGFVNAQTGEILGTLIRLYDLISYATLETKYSGTKTNVETKYYDGAYHLFDDSRATTIHVWDLNNGDNYSLRKEFSDNNNYWGITEHNYWDPDPNVHANFYDYMAHDIHWGLQKIYDYLLNTYSMNSFDFDGHPIDAYAQYSKNSNDPTGAFYDPNDTCFLFGHGGSDFLENCAPDVVAHEYAHGITHLNIGWTDEYDAEFREGLSDIWSVILEARIAPSRYKWQLNDGGMYKKFCLRDFANPGNPNALQQIYDTYGSYEYNHSDYWEQKYERSGVFSRWFYLLSEGGKGTNDIDNSYTVYGVGLDDAERILSTAEFNDGHISDDIDTYPELRTLITDAARALSVTNSIADLQVQNAWYAVGVGSEPPQTQISGPETVCGASTFSLSYIPTGASVTWQAGPSIVTPNSGNGSSATIYPTCT